MMPIHILMVITVVLELDFSQNCISGKDLTSFLYEIEI